MEKVDVTLVNAFTKERTGGNPAGVVLNADGLSEAQKLSVAKEIGYSETAFVCADDEADFEVSFFTPTDEVDFCGHATVATFSTLFQTGKITAGTYIQRTKAGLLSVDVEPSGKIVMEQTLPQTLGRFSYGDIANLIGLESELLENTQLPIEIISTGLPDVIVPVPTGYLDKLKPNDDAILAFSQKHTVVGLHVFELCNTNDQEQTTEGAVLASCRNFAPLFGIPEESATGSGCGALASYLTKHTHIGNEYVFEQGRAMNCSSLITASVKTSGSDITQVKVGGFAEKIGQREVLI